MFSLSQNSTCWKLYKYKGNIVCARLPPMLEGADQCIEVIYLPSLDLKVSREQIVVPKFSTPLLEEFKFIDYPPDNRLEDLALDTEWSLIGDLIKWKIEKVYTSRDGTVSIQLKHPGGMFRSKSVKPHMFWQMYCRSAG